MTPIKQRIISLILAIISAVSLIPLTNVAYAAYGDGLGNTSSISKHPGSGGWSPNSTGIRVYIVDSSGKLVSNIVDLTNRDINGDKRVVACFGSRGNPEWQGFEEGTLKQYGGPYSNTTTESEKGTFIDILSPSAISPGATYAQHACKVPLADSGALPIQYVTETYKTVNGKKVVDKRHWYTRGTNLRKYMLGNEAGGELWMNTEGSAGGDFSSEEITYEGIREETFGEALKKWENTLWERVELYKQNENYTDTDILGLMGETVAEITNEINGLDEDGLPKYDEDEKGTVLALLFKFQAELKDKVKNGTLRDNDNNDNKEYNENDSLSAFNFNKFLDIAYADDSDDEGIQPLYTNGGLIPLMEQVVGETPLFVFKDPSTNLKGGQMTIDPATGKKSVMLTCAENNFVIYMEPIYWASPQKLKKGGGAGDTADYYFYGTVSNYAAWMPINWTNNGNPPIGGNYERSLNTSFVWSMYTDADLDAPSVKAGTSFPVSPGNRVTDAQMNSPDYGIALHWYKFKINTARLPRIPTYNYHDQDPNPDPHKPQHPGDPEKEPPGTIPLTPGEPKTPEEYKKVTRTVNIVKVYDTELLDGTRIHDETHYQENCPGTIDILDEPDWKAIEYISSPFYYKDEHDLNEKTEWDEVKDYVSGKVSFEHDITKEDGTVEKHISIAQPTQDVGEVPWDEVKDKSAKDKLGEVKLGVACDCTKQEGGEEVDPRDGQHYWDTTLYVHLLRKEKIPETSTFDEPDFPPKGKPPYIPPHGSDDPFQPTPSDPETDHVDEGNRFAHYRIVKLYETIRITADGEQPPEPDGVFTTYKTNPIVYIQDEKQSNDIYDGSWHLEDWDISDDYNPPLPDLWDDLTGTYSAKESGTTEAKVDLRDKDDKEKEVTLYVHLVRRIKEANPTGAIIIQQSQISKAIRTNDAVIGGKFGNYRFAMTVGDYAETHTSYYHDYCCRSSETHDCGHCHGHTCKMNMPGNWGDDKVNFNFDLTSSQDELEIKKGVNQNTNPQVYGHSGGAVDALDPGQNYPETVPSLKASANKYYYTSNGKDKNGAEYVTILWRGTSKDNYKDIPTLAKFKESDVKLTFGSTDNYNIPKDMLASVGSQPNRKTNQKRASTYLVTDLEFQFGVHGRSDLEATSSCSNIGSFKGGCVHTETQSYYPIEGTEFTYDFKAGVAIRFYAGKSKSLQAMPFGSKTSTPILEKKTGNHKELNVIQCKQQINFYPYIRMTYMVNSLDDATKEAQNTDTNGYKQDVRYDTYILSEYESQVLPSDAVRVEWEKKGAEENLLLTSQQWSVHQKAVNGSAVWNGKNQVLPGGAIYQLSTPEGGWVKMGLTTYQTVIDQKARNEYLTASNTLSGDEYTEAKVAKDHLEFINDAKEVLDNLKVVQWVNRNAGASTAWPKDFKPSPSNGIIKILDGLELSSIDLSGLRGGSKTHPNDDQKYYMRQQTQFSNYQSSKLSEWTKTIDESQGIKEQSYEGDLDIFNFEHTTTVFKLFTDTSGNVYLAKMEKKYGKNDTGVDNNEQDIKSMVQSMQELDWDTYNKGQTGGATVTKLCDKKVAGTGINSRLTDKDAKDIDDATSFITNFVSALTRNKGVDYTAEWSSGQKDGTWYNEAFDGAYLVRQKAVFNVGFAFSSTRTSALDPALCPQNKGQSDLYTKAFLSQFCTDSQSDAAVAQGKKQNYLGTFKDTDITLPDMESLYISKKFYIPNANVQDLN